MAHGLGGGSLRRSMVHIAAAAGWTPEQIAAVTGHTSTSVVERFYLDGYAGVWTRSGEGRQMLLEGSDQWATCPLNVDAGAPRPARQPGHRCWWQDRDLEADKVRAMDLGTGNATSRGRGSPDDHPGRAAMGGVLCSRRRGRRETESATDRSVLH